MSLKFKIAWGATIIILSFCCGMPLMHFLFNQIGDSYILEGLYPSDYPGGELVDQQRRSGSGGHWTTTIYRVPDRYDKVLAFMEADLPGFTQRQALDASEVEPVYSNRNCAYDTSLGRYFFGRGYYPCVSVTFYPDPNNPQETLIFVSDSFPDP